MGPHSDSPIDGDATTTHPGTQPGGPNRSPDCATEVGTTLQGEEIFIIATEEFFALICGVLAFIDEFKGGLLAYATDNKIVEAWLDKRSANHPLACFVLVLLAAIESTYKLYVFYCNFYSFSITLYYSHELD